MIRYEVPFDLDDHLTSFDSRLLNEGAGRIALTRADPLLFALLYLPHHLKSPDGLISFSPFHVDLCEQALEWMAPLGHLREDRDAYVAARESGKSTWLFLVLPLWAAAHGHVTYITAFADSSTQAEQHLETFRKELNTNPLLAQDFPEFCTPAKRTDIQMTISNRQSKLVQANGFTFQAKGIDSSTLGAKEGAVRPQLIIMDDIEPGESNYSEHQMEKRLSTIQNVILPLNAFARVLLVGTVTMPGSLIHQLVQSVIRDEDPQPWITEENFRVHYYPALIETEAGHASFWPEKWSVDKLLEQVGRHSFALNFQNDPIIGEAAYWSVDDFRISNAEVYGATGLFVDPAITTKKTSDWTGLAVVSRDIDNSKMAYVRHAEHVKLAGAALRDHVLGIVEAYEEIAFVMIETNQGGDTWLEILHDMPVRVLTKHHSDHKTIRASRVHNAYARQRVYHTRDFPILMDEMLRFGPKAKGRNDDVLDAVVMGVTELTMSKKKQRKPSVSLNYT